MGTKALSSSLGISQGHRMLIMGRGIASSRLSFSVGIFVTSNFLVGCDWLWDMTRVKVPCALSPQTELACENCVDMADGGTVHVRRISALRDTIQAIGDTCLMMVIGSGCPGLASEMPKLIERLKNSTTHRIMLVLQDELEHLPGARHKAMVWGWKDRIYALDQDECGCYLDVRARSRVVLDVLNVKRPEEYHLAASLLLLLDPAGNVIASSQYLEFPLRDQYAL